MPCTQADYCKQYKDSEKCMKDDKCYFYRMKPGSGDDKKSVGDKDKKPVDGKPGDDSRL